MRYLPRVFLNVFYCGTAKGRESRSAPW